MLKKKEEKEGFDEAIYSVKDGKTKSFFNLGNKNNYKTTDECAETCGGKGNLWFINHI